MVILGSRAPFPKCPGVLCVQVRKVSIRPEAVKVNYWPLKKLKLKCAVKFEETLQSVEIDNLVTSSKSRGSGFLVWEPSHSSKNDGTDHVLLDVEEYFGPSSFTVTVSAKPRAIASKILQVIPTTVVGECNGKLLDSVPSSVLASNNKEKKDTVSNSSSQQQQPQDSNSSVAHGDEVRVQCTSVTTPVNIKLTKSRGEEDAVSSSGGSDWNQVRYELSGGAGYVELCLYFAPSKRNSIARMHELHKAASKGHVSLVRRLLATGGINLITAISSPSSSGLSMTPLDVAAKSGQTEILEAMRDCISTRLVGTCVKSKSNRGMSLLHYAVESGNQTTVESVISMVNEAAISHERRTSLIARQHGLLFDFPEENTSRPTEEFDVLDKKNGQGLSPLALACTIPGAVGMVKLLVQNGADVAVVDNGKNTPLLLACKLNDFDIVEYLLSLRGTGPSKITVIAKPNMSNSLGDFPLHVAAKLGNSKIVSKLLENGASVMPRHNSGGSVFHAAALSGNIDVIKILAKWVLGRCSVELDDGLVQQLDFKIYDMNALQSISSAGGSDSEGSSLENGQDNRGGGVTRRTSRRIRKAASRISVLSKRTAKVRQRAKSWASSKRRGSSETSDGVEALVQAENVKDSKGGSDDDDVHKLVAAGIGRDGRGGTGKNIVPIGILLFRDSTHRDKASECAHRNGHNEAGQLLSKLESIALAARSKWAGCRNFHVEYDEDHEYEYEWNSDEDE